MSLEGKCLAAMCYVSETNSMPNFRAIKNFQKALSDITRKIETLAGLSTP